eukprot:5550507-Amphidinium_carterae.1
MHMIRESFACELVASWMDIRLTTQGRIASELVHVLMFCFVKRLKLEKVSCGVVALAALYSAHHKSRLSWHFHTSIKCRIACCCNLHVAIIGQHMSRVHHDSLVTWRIVTRFTACVKLLGLVL